MKKKNYKLQKVTHKSPEIMLNVMANNPTEAMYGKLQLFYRGCYENTIAYMEAMDSETGQLVEILVGYALNPETKKIDVYPLAKILSMSEAGKFICPTGHGDYHNVTTKPEASNES